jgi:DNA-binding HxlR family transcriptional regulator
VRDGGDHEAGVGERLGRVRVVLGDATVAVKDHDQRERAAFAWQPDDDIARAVVRVGHHDALDGDRLRGRARTDKRRREHRQHQPHDGTHHYIKYSDYILVSMNAARAYPDRMAKRYGQACPVAKSLELVGERWTLLIVRDLLDGPRRFQDFHASLPGIAPALLSERLKLMEEHGLCARRFYSEHPPRAEYVLTDKGRELGFVIGALATWGSRHVHASTALVSGDCGHEVQLRYFCPQCAKRVRGSTVRVSRRRVRKPL